VESWRGLKLADELLGSSVAERLVGTERVVVASPVFDDYTRVGQRTELVLVETFIPKAVVERFDVGVLGRLARVNEVQANSPIACRTRWRISATAFPAIEL